MIKTSAHNDPEKVLAEAASETQTTSACEFQDIEIDCIDCDIKFVWSVGEQSFFRDKGLKNPPKRCKPCKRAKNERIHAINYPNYKKKIEVSVECVECKINTTVPFYPCQGRPVYCRHCFIKNKSEQRQEN